MRDQGAVPSMIPQGAGSAPLPGMDLKKRGKLMCVKVCLLNQTTAVFHLGHKALGEALFDEVCRYLNLLEKDYFGLEFLDCYGNRCWLDKEKTILRQITQAHSDGKFYFVVKFYTPNPSELEEEYTRYLLSLQIKRDLAMGEFICIENTAALMVAYLVQSECGDFSPDDYPDHSYLSARNFVPNQTIPFQIKVMQNHKQLIGMNPAESEFALLETARRCDFYGVKFHAAKDVEASAVNLSVVHGGIKVFQNLHFVTTFSWAKIRKLSFKRKKLLIKLHPESYQFYKETIEFGFETRNECKNFWKKCVEHHAFFRCVDVAETKKPKESRLFSRGSSFRYHGRTQKQLIDYVREHHKRREPFTRPINAGLSLERDRLARLHYGLGPSGYATLERKQQKPVSFTSSMPHIGQAPAQGTASVSGATFTPFTVSTTVAHPPRSRPASQYYYRNHSDHLSDDLSGDERMCTSDIDTSTTTAAAAEKPQRRFPEKQQTPMSLSLPNVLSDDVRLVCREFELQCECPPKSVSGDNFLERLGADDNVSEDSYRLADHESSQPNILNTTFTAKRVGNVIVKRIMAKSTPNTTDDEESTASESAPVHRKALRPSAKYYSPFHPQATSLTRTTAPIEIDGPNVKLPAPLPSEAPTYTSTGALLVRPKLIDVAKENGASERSGAYKTFSEKRPEVYAVPPTLNGVSGPLPGRVLARDNIVITPEGIKEKRPKPVVPPKPKNLPRPVVHMHDVDDTVSEPIMPPPPTATSPKAQSEVLQMPTVDSAISGPPKESTRSAPLQKSKSEDLMKRPPTLISVESVDQPEVKKCHLFNSEIPYVLTMRTVEAPSQERQSPAATSFGGGRRKSFDFVPKKHLPSPGSFSSQDHSVSPTTPDSGNVLEYVLRRRSLSSERAQKERRRRHLTQPIRLDDAGPVEALHKLSRSQELCEFHDDLPPPPEAPRSPPEDLNNEPMPSPPPPPPPPTSGASSGTPPYIDDSSSKEEEGAAPPPAVAATHDGAPKSLRTPSGLLWTDF
ncbi:hypothetical protein QR680_017556 [Steinernema hermaphroditum]|uniref:FERM domain-containing protein n=1 Tax=Steinernema hermaphroditum TaxID=289476 RepID=A0AA39HG75_9BILA|nr:hypothetical protein QR680_017556 [Steinernema hermaphroditum]